MLNVAPRQLALYGLGLIAVLVLGLRYLGGASGNAPAAPPAPPIRVQANEEGELATVHVAGAVRRPGVYRLRAGARVEEAVRRAGGAAPRADLAAVNLAAKVEDGRQVLLPSRLPTATAEAPATDPARAGAAEVPLNLNTATLEQLDALDGIGPTIAQEILDYRDAHDGFGSVEELGQVPGIGDTRLAALRERVRV